MCKILALASVCAALGLAISGWSLAPLSPIELALDKFKESQVEGIRFTHLPKNLEKWTSKGVRVRVWADEDAIASAPSLDALQSEEAPAFRIKADAMLYVNEPLYELIVEPSVSVVAGADLPGRLKTDSMAALALALLAAMFALLSSVVAQSHDVGRPDHGRMTQLDSLRGIAAVIVLVMHALGLFFPPAWFDWGQMPDAAHPRPPFAELMRNSPFAILINGSLMVHIFWILSGLVLSLPLLRSRSHQTVGRSAVKRYFRLLPMAFVTTIASYAFHRAGWYPLSEFNAGTNFGVAMLVMSGGSELSLWNAVKDALTFGHSFNMPLWTIRAEFVGSIALFGLIACTLPLGRRRIVWCTCLAVLLAVTRQVYLADFVLGLLIADSLLRSGDSPRLRRGMSLLLGAGVIVLGSSCPGWLSATVPPLGEEYIRMAAAAMSVVLAARSESVSKLLGARPLVWLGQRSFALYAVHALVIHLVGHRAATIGLQFGLSPILSACVGLAVALLVTLLVSDWLTRTVDYPSQVLANRIGRWIVGSPAQDSARTNADALLANGGRAV